MSILSQTMIFIGFMLFWPIYLIFYLLKVIYDYFNVRASVANGATKLSVEDSGFFDQEPFLVEELDKMEAEMEQMEETFIKKDQMVAELKQQEQLEESVKHEQDFMENEVEAEEKKQKDTKIVEPKQLEQITNQMDEQEEKENMPLAEVEDGGTVYYKLNDETVSLSTETEKKFLEPIIREHIHEIEITEIQPVIHRHFYK